MPIDARLKWLLEERSAPSPEFLPEAVESITGTPAEEVIRPTWIEPQPFDVLVRAAPNAQRSAFLNALQKYGFELHSLSGSSGALLASGSIGLDDIERLDTEPLVQRIEVPRDLTPELVTSLNECTALAAHLMVPPARGGNALVGIIDIGIDYTHQVLRSGTTTRILAFWDQLGTWVPGGPVPYGRLYTRADIDAALGGTPLAHSDVDGHGTHVTSCAAGSSPRNGVAPNADLLVVSLRKVRELGRSKEAIDAFDWVVRQAKQEGRPVAINLSQGMNGGSHAGSSSLEVAMDIHCREPGVALVKSAGNEQEWRTHASSTITAGGIVTFEVECRTSKRTPGQLELWFDEADDVEIQIAPPGGPPSGWFNQATMPQTLSLGGNTIRIDVDIDPEGIGDNLYTVFFAAGSAAGGIKAGTWNIQLRAAKLGGGGLVHAWLERTSRSPGSEQLWFSVGSNDPTCTLTTPGTGRRVICVGAYVTAPDPPGSATVGTLSNFSSRGPTRYGVPKPDLIAPGEMIEAARSAASPGTGTWRRRRGTSMAAPHVTGAAALLLSEDKTLTGDQIRQILAATARPTTGTNNDVGAGYLDVHAAVNLVRTARPVFPTLSGVPTIASPLVTIHTLAGCTAKLLYSTSPGRLLGGRAMGAIPSAAAGTTHVFDLTPLGTSTWHFEIHLVSGSWQTITDDRGVPWSMTIP